ncbi:uncharacterized protein M421DRAFT_78155 [Didymella exigua CBS 183.55]|uniref:Concanavalin A-like lectin/glucanase n=1 Tax=Didymella exigua CBS 183.55 TaxID=1150837 RepID=A0A6A5R316_9PLEO|nr:uncharacterized protein M421DRAFT_78155 [Didymella exigua CBS 183.55]KAF1922455.1 hypothetical protein M421DRAFT_78155 [Didymella exigua CBS 183.55]
MKPSSALAFFGSATAFAASNALRRQSSTDVVENGSFEAGTAGWTLTGPASIVSNDDSNEWSFTAAEGTHFALVSTWSNSNNTGSSLATPVSGLPFTAPQSLSFDWNYLVSSTGRGPPSIQCTLQTNVFSGMTVQGWTRRASAGGSGSVQESFTTGAPGGTVTIAFGCTGDAGTAKVDAGVAIDNVRWSGTVV